MLGDDLAAILPELRAQAVSRMRTPCLVRRPGGTTADPETGADVSVYDPVWSGFCRIGQQSITARAGESAEATVLTQQLQIHIPVGVGPVRSGDEVLADGRAFRVDGTHDKDQQTAQRLPVTEITSTDDPVEGVGTVDIGTGAPTAPDGGFYFDESTGNLYQFTED